MFLAPPSASDTRAPPGVRLDPLLVAVACLVLGATLAVAALPALAAFTASALALVRRLGLRLLLSALVGAGLGGWRASAALEAHAGAWKAGRAFLPSPARCFGEGRVTASPTRRGPNLRFDAELTTLDCEGRTSARPWPVRLYVSASAAPPLERGSHVSIVADLAPTSDFRNDGVPDPRPGATRRGAVLSGSAILVRLERRSASGRAFIDRARAHVRERILATFAPSVAGLARALVLGENDLEPDDERVFQRSGLSHLLAVSGTHLVLAVLALVRGLEALAKRAECLSARCDVRRPAALLGLCLAPLYADFAGGSGSAWRAAYMLCAVLGVRVLGRHAFPSRVLACSLAGGWLGDPLVVFDPSFMLSIGATSGLLVFGRGQNERQLARAAALTEPRRPDPTRLLRAIADAALTTLAATLPCVPLLLAISPGLSLASVAANLLAAPLGEAVALPLCLGHALCWPFPSLERGVALVASGALALIRGIAIASASVEWLYIEIPPPNAWHLAVLAATVPIAIAPHARPWLDVRAGAAATRARSVLGASVRSATASGRVPPWPAVALARSPSPASTRWEPRSTRSPSPDDSLRTAPGAVDLNDERHGRHTLSLRHPDAMGAGSPAAGSEGTVGATLTSAPTPSTQTFGASQSNGEMPSTRRFGASQSAAPTPGRRTFGASQSSAAPANTRAFGASRSSAEMPNTTRFGAGPSTAEMPSTRAFGASQFEATPFGRSGPTEAWSRTWISAGQALAAPPLSAPRSATRRSRAALALGVLVLALVEAATRWQHSATRHRSLHLLRVTALDVGQGDATLIDLPDGRLMLVDGGGNVGVPVDPGERVILPVLRARRRERIDILVLTHPHPDHLGGLLSVARDLPVGELWYGGAPPPPDSDYERLLRLLTTRGVPLRDAADLCANTVSNTLPREASPHGIRLSDARPDDAVPSDAHPNGARLSDGHANGAVPSDRSPSGTLPSDGAPHGMSPSDARPNGAVSSDRGPSGTLPSEARAHGRSPSDGHTNGAVPSDRGPSGTLPSEARAHGRSPSDARSNGALPSGTHPRDAHPGGATPPSDARPNGALPRGVHPSSTPPSDAPPNGAVPSGVHPSSTPPSERASEARPTADVIEPPHTGQSHEPSAHPLAPVDVRVLHPCPIDPAQNLNDNSLVIRISHGRHAALLMGDAELWAEQRLLATHPTQLGADLLKVGHHGSRTSSSPTFLRAVQPHLATISAGIRNRFAHPHPETLAHLLDSGALSLRLDQLGSITWQTNGTTQHIQTWLTGNLPTREPSP